MIYAFQWHHVMLMCSTPTYQSEPHPVAAVFFDKQAMGIPLKFVQCDDGVDDALICSKCCQLLENPAAIVCGHFACKECLKEAEKQDKKILCQKCYKPLKGCGSTEVPNEVKTELESLSIQCSLGCDKVIIGCKDHKSHVMNECQYRQVQCPNKGCIESIPVKDTQHHYEVCLYTLTQCSVCKAIVTKRDMPAHQAVKRCFEKIVKRERVQSARKLSEDLKSHHEIMLKQKHLSDQNERHMIRDHYTKDESHSITRRSSIQSRIGSALVVTDNYSRRGLSRSLSCGKCEGHFLSGRRPSARRDSTAKVIMTTLISLFPFLSFSPFIPPSLLLNAASKLFPYYYYYYL